jgi:deoxycytidine triphosphate deaminase
MEITNNSQHYSIPLVVGRRIAQIVCSSSPIRTASALSMLQVFFESEGILDASYEKEGKYQNSDDIEELKR